MVIHFTDALALTDSIPLASDGEAHKAPTCAADYLTGELRRLAAERGIRYVKIVGEQIVCAAGLQNDAGARSDWPAVAADLALAVQDRCTRLFTELHRPLAFRIGIDFGPVLGSRVGDQHEDYNLWGDALSGAVLMAETAPPGAVHVTASAYQRLREAYLFTLRGRYYLAALGELATYTLTGKV